MSQLLHNSHFALWNQQKEDKSDNTHFKNIQMLFQVDKSEFDVQVRGQLIIEDTSYIIHTFIFFNMIISSSLQEVLNNTCTYCTQENLLKILLCVVYFKEQIQFHVDNVNCLRMDTPGYDRAWEKEGGHDTCILHMENKKPFKTHVSVLHHLCVLCYWFFFLIFTVKLKNSIISLEKFCFKESKPTRGPWAILLT